MNSSASLRLLPAIGISFALLCSLSSVVVAADTNTDGLVVTAPRDRPGRTLLGGDKLGTEPYLHLGEGLEEVPGVTAVRRGASATEPVIRGLRGERVRTRLGVVPLWAACPSNMDPPVTYFAAHAFQRAQVDIGLPDVTHGAAGLGGQIVISPDYERPEGAEDEIHALVGGLFDTARLGGRGEAAVWSGNDWLDFRASAGGGYFGDYESGDGVEVPAEQGSVSGSLSLGFRPWSGHRFWHALRYAREMDVDFPALPMDIRHSDLLVYNGGYRIDGISPLVERIELSGGFSWVDHLMDNENKPNRGKMEAETPSTASSAAGVARVVLTPNPILRVETGLDFEWMGRDATRTRKMLASDATFEDHVWPDVNQMDLGAFVDVTLELPFELKLSAAGRGDLFWSTADGADDPSLGGMTVADQWERFYGADARDPDSTEGLGAARLQLEWQPLHELSAHVGGGFVMRAAGATERYFAFGPAPGGFQVGNPGLESEKRWTLDAGVHAELPWLEADLGVFVSQVHDYVLENVIARQDVNGDGVDDSVRGFDNVTAQFVGAELGAVVRPTDYLSIPLSLAWVRGRNTTADTPLPQMPPLEGRAAIRLEMGHTVRWWLQVGTRFAAPQDDVDEGFPENTTDGWITLDARGGVELWESLRVEVGARNLLDADYNEHLSRPSPLGGGDLQAKDEIPAPGRSFFVNARYLF